MRTPGSAARRVSMDVYNRLLKYVGYHAELGAGVITFTAGIGENDAAVRRAANPRPLRRESTSRRTGSLGEPHRPRSTVTNLRLPDQRGVGDRPPGADLRLITPKLSRAGVSTWNPASGITVAWLFPPHTVYRPSDQEVSSLAAQRVLAECQSAGPTGAHVAPWVLHLPVRRETCSSLTSTRLAGWHALFQKGSQEV